MPLSSRALRHLSPELVPSCRTRCEHAVVFHKSVTPFRMQWQVSNFLHKLSHLHLLFSPFRYLFPICFIRPSCHASPPSFLPPLHASEAQLNIAQNTPLQNNHDKTLSHELFRLFLPVPRPLLKPMAQKMAFMVIR